MTSLPYRILTLENKHWQEFIKYETLEECISYLENVNPTLRPAQIVTGQRVIRAYDYGVIDYEMINRIEEENEELRNGLWELTNKKLQQSNKALDEIREFNIIHSNMTLQAILDNLESKKS